MEGKGDNEFTLKEDDSSKISSTSKPMGTSVGESPKNDFKLYKIRWPIVILFSTSMIAGGTAQIGLSPIMSIISEIYDKEGIITSMLVLPFTIFFIPLMFPANYIIKHYGITIPVFIASITLIIGAWIRLLVNTNFYFLLAGQWIMALGQPFVISSPAKLAGVWFGDHERAIATTLGSLAAPFGAVIGYLLPLPLISDADAKPQSQGESRFFRYILIQSIIITVLSLPILFIIRNKPPTPPSVSAATVLKKKKSDGMFKNTVKLFKSIDFLLMMVAFSSVFSVYTTLGAAIGPLTRSFGYKSKSNSIFGWVYIIGGVLGSFTHAIFLDKYARFKFQYIIIGVMNWTSFALVAFLISQGSVALTTWLLFFMGFSQLPIIGVTYAFVAEMTYPIDEALSWGVVHLLGSVVATGFAFMTTTLVDNGNNYLALYILLGLCVTGLLAKWLIREVLKKKRAGITGTIFSFHIGNQSFPNSYHHTFRSQKAENKPLIDHENTNGIE